MLIKKVFYSFLTLAFLTNYSLFSEAFLETQQEKLSLEFDDSDQTFLSFEEGTLYQNPLYNSYVSCKLMGQLGNHMFQIATTLAYAWDHNAIPVFPGLNSKEERLSYERDRIFFRLNASKSPKPFKNMFSESAQKGVGPFHIPNKIDMFLVGYFQSWVYFHHHREKILDIFAPSQEILNKLHAKYRNLIDNPNTVAVHVRTVDHTQHANPLFHFAGLDYYKRAFEFFSSDSIFVVFSDRINWCKANFPKFEKNFVFIEGNDHIEDLFLMSMMKNIIICNSTFSWWAAYLNRNPNKIVVAVKDWPPPKIYFDDWITIPPDLDAPYPSDMYNYDRQSQSINNNK